MHRFHYSDPLGIVHMRKMGTNYMHCGKVILTDNLVVVSDILGLKSCRKCSDALEDFMHQIDEFLDRAFRR